MAIRALNRGCSTGHQRLVSHLSHSEPAAYRRIGTLVRHLPPINEKFKKPLIVAEVRHPCSLATVMNAIYAVQSDYQNKAQTNRPKFYQVKIEGPLRESLCTSVPNGC